MQYRLVFVITSVVSCLIAQSFGSSSSSVCLPCTIQINGSDELNNTVDHLQAKIQGISVLVFRFHDLYFNTSSLEDNVVYDPTWWAWSRTSSDVFFTMPPLTMDVLSLNTLTMTVREIDISVLASPAGCIQHLNMECLTNKLSRILLRVLDPIRSEVRDQMKRSAYGVSDVLCQSSYVGLSNITVGWHCLQLSRGNIDRLSDNSSSILSMMNSIEPTELARVALVMAFLLPAIPVLRCLVSSFGCKNIQRRDMEIESEAEVLRKSNLRGALSNLAEQCEQDEQTRIAVEEIMKGFSQRLAHTQSELEQTLTSIAEEVDAMQAKLAHALQRLAYQHQLSNTGEKAMNSTGNSFSLLEYDIFELKKTANDSSAACRHWLVMNKRSILDHESGAPFLQLLQQSLLNEKTRCSYFEYALACGLEVIRKSASFIGAHICLSYWLCNYSWRSFRFTHLNGDLKIFKNLLAAPASWFFANESAAFVIACVAAVVHLVFIVVVFLPGFVRVSVPICVKSRTTRRRLLHYLSVIQLNVAARFILTLVIIMEYINTYALVSSLSTSFLYLLVGLIVNIKAASPYVTGLVTFFYYLGTFFHGVTDKYTMMKRFLFKFSCDSKNVKWKATKCEMNARLKLNLEELRARRVFLEGVVMYEADSRKHSLIFEQLLDISVTFYPIAARLRTATVRFIMEMQFIVLIVLVMLSFRSSLFLDSISIVIATIVSLLSSLIPKFTESFRGAEIKKLKEAALESQLTDYLINAGRKYAYQVLISNDCSCPHFQSASITVEDGGDGNGDVEGDVEHLNDADQPLTVLLPTQPTAEANELIPLVTAQLANDKRTKDSGLGEAAV